jgi:hypothetical protein
MYLSTHSALIGRVCVHRYGKCLDRGWMIHEDAVEHVVGFVEGCQVRLDPLLLLTAQPDERNLQNAVADLLRVQDSAAGVKIAVMAAVPHVNLLMLRLRVVPLRTKGCTCYATQATLQIMPCICRHVWHAYCACKLSVCAFTLIRLGVTAVLCMQRCLCCYPVQQAGWWSPGKKRCPLCSSTQCTACLTKQRC